MSFIQFIYRKLHACMYRNTCIYLVSSIHTYTHIKEHCTRLNFILYKCRRKNIFTFKSLSFISELNTWTTANIRNVSHLHSCDLHTHLKVFWHFRQSVIKLFFQIPLKDPSIIDADECDGITQFLSLTEWRRRQEEQRKNWNMKTIKQLIPFERKTARFYNNFLSFFSTIFFLCVFKMNLCMGQNNDNWIWGGNYFNLAMTVR